MNKVNLVPDARNLMESTRSIGYSLESAVADLIDNSLAAKAKNIYVETPTDNFRYFCILDDGVGMSEAELESAMRYGSSSVNEERSGNDLGRFGLGLKVASMSQGRVLIVASKQEGKEIVAAKWDLDYVAKQSWTLQVYTQKEIHSIPGVGELEKMKSGTLVVWSNLDILLKDFGDSIDNSKSYADKISVLKGHLELVFHRYISEDNLHIELNGKCLKARDPFLKEFSTKPFEKDTYILCGKKIEIQPYVLPAPSKMTKQQLEEVGDLFRGQGFYIYRNRRLIIYGTWFRLDSRRELSKLARVQVDIPVSKEIDKLWDLDVKKSRANIPEGLRMQLSRVVQNMTTRSTKVVGKRSRHLISDDSLWRREETPNKEVNYFLKRDNSLIKAAIASSPLVEPLLKLIEQRLPSESIYYDLASQRKFFESTDSRENIIQGLMEAGYSSEDAKKLTESGNRNESNQPR